MTGDWKRLSEYLVMLVQIVFGVVIAQSLDRFSAVLIHPFTAAHTTALLALVTVYVTTVLSWVDWHSTMLASPYNLNFYNLNRRWEQLRLYTDVGIVIVYAYLLFSITPFETKPSSNIGWHLFGYVLVYALYLLSGWTRRQSYGPAASSYPPILVFLAFVSVFVGAYFVVAHTRGTEQWANALWIAGFFASSVLYRQQRRRYRRDRANVRRQSPTVGIDVDGVLADQVTGVLPIIERKHGITLTYTDVTDWRLPVGDSDIAVEIEEALREPRYILAMKPHPDAREVISKLYKDHKILILTARSAEAREATVLWLHNQRIPFDDVLTTREATKSVHGTDVLVDDYLGNITEFLENSAGRAVLVDQPWNREREVLDEWAQGGRVEVAGSLTQALPMIQRLARQAG